MAEKEKELTVEGEVLAEDPAVSVVADLPVVEVNTDTLVDKYNEVPEEVLTSGIGVGMTSGYADDKMFQTGSSVGIAGEKDERAKTVQGESQKGHK